MLTNPVSEALLYYSLYRLFRSILCPPIRGTPDSCAIPYGTMLNNQEALATKSRKNNPDPFEGTSLLQFVLKKRLFRSILCPPTHGAPDWYATHRFKFGDGMLSKVP